MRKSIPIQDDGSIVIPTELTGEVFGKAREAVVHLRSGCLVVSPVYVDLDSGTLPTTLARFFRAQSLDTVLEKHFQKGAAEPIQFEGELSVLALTDVFLFLSASKKTGALVIEDKERWGFFFEHGDLVFATSDQQRNGLAAYLLKRQFLTEQDLASALKLLDNDQEPLPALQDVSGLTREEFAEQRVRSVEDIVYQVFTLTTGRFQFENGLVQQPYKLVLPLSTTNYVMEATRRIDEWARIQDRVPPEDTVLEVVEDVTASTKLTFEEEHVLAQITGKRALGEIVAGAKVGEMDGKKAVASLLAAGLIRAKKAEANPEPPPKAQEEEKRIPEAEREALSHRIETYNNVFSTIFQALSMEVGSKTEVILGAFFKGLEEGESLLAGQALDEGGMLPPEGLLSRIRNFEENREQKLVSDLNELLYFQLFAVKNTLGPEMESGIVEMAKTLLQET